MCHFYIIFIQKKYTSLDDYIQPKNHTFSKIYIIQADNFV